jgi:capsid protein
MHPIDRLIATFSPEAGLRRARARLVLDNAQKSGFWRQASQQSTNRKPSGQSLDHQDSRRGHTDRIALIREARHLEENNPIIASILRKYQTFVVGRFRHADLSGRHTFRALAALAVASMKRDGDIGFLITEDEDKGKIADEICPIRIQAIEADRIGAIYSAGQDGVRPFRKLARGEQDFSGVIVDSLGRPVRYRVYNRRDKGESFDPWREVPAQDFIHVFDPIRCDAYRGFSAFGSSINDIKDMQELLAIEKVGVKLLASISGVVEGGDGTVMEDVDLDGGLLAKTADGSQLRKIEAGTIEHLPQGHKFNPLEFTRPSPTFNGFMETLTRWGGLAFNLPYGVIYSWAGQGTAVRMEAAQADREFQHTQLLLEEKLLCPIIERVIARGVQLGHIPAVPDFDAGEWRYPAKMTADVGRESKAEIEEVKMGLRSKTQVNADHGEDRQIVRDFTVSEQLEAIEDAKKIMAASGGEIDLKTALWMLEKSAPNPPTMMPEAEEKEEKPEGNSAIIPQQPVFNVISPAHKPKTRSVSFVRKNGEIVGAEITEHENG